MSQLIMRWKNDGTESTPIIFPEGVSVCNWSQMVEPLDAWLDIVRYGLSEKKRTKRSGASATIITPVTSPLTALFSSAKDNRLPR